MVPQAACTAPVPLGTSLATRALSAMSVPICSPKVVPLTQTDIRCAGEPCWSAPAHEVRASADPAIRTREATRDRRLMWPGRRGPRGALAQHDVTVVQEVGGNKPASGVGLPDVVDVGPTAVDGAARLLLGTGQAGALEEVSEGEAARAARSGERSSWARPRSPPAASPRSGRRSPRRRGRPRPPRTWPPRPRRARAPTTARARARWAARRCGCSAVSASRA